ncbi:MAG: type II toxin-antitoxin system VapC family toxin [Treponema sp.]|jgi:predicted nucleic acid-binding protein|nr:type II toxin-antitoxin system VapC family toxin [Treponema sp.]
MVYVYDSSFVSALIIPDEKNPKIDKLHRAVSESDEIFTPQLLWYEMTNIFMHLLRRRRYSHENVYNLLPCLSAIRLTTDFENGINYSTKIFLLCDKYKLNSYDAAYLELAARKKAVLCTLDRGLRIAAKKHGIEVIDMV